MELSFGDWEGQTLSEVGEHSPQLIEERERGKWSFRPPGDRAESYAMLAERTDKFLASVDRPTICVAHGGVIRTLFSASARFPMKTRRWSTFRKTGYSRSDGDRSAGFDSAQSQRRYYSTSSRSLIIRLPLTSCKTPRP
jgi:broad specificity phosphatase PhoE